MLSVVFQTSVKIFDVPVENHILLFIPTNSETFNTTYENYKSAAAEFRGKVCNTESYYTNTNAKRSVEKPHRHLQKYTATTLSLGLLNSLKNISATIFQLGPLTELSEKFRVNVISKQFFKTKRSQKPTLIPAAPTQLASDFTHTTFLEQFPTKAGFRKLLAISACTRKWTKDLRALPGARAGSSYRA